MKTIPIVRRNYLADGSFWTDILASTKTGAKKMQFPFDIPTVNTNNEVALSPTTQMALIATASVITIGIIGGAILRRKTKQS